MAKYNVFRNGLVLAIIVSFFGASLLPSISGNVENMDNDFYRKNIFNISNNGPGVDDWEIVDTVGWWHFDEGSDYIAFDSSSYGNDGICYGTEWTTDTPDGSPYSLRFFADNNSVVIVDDDTENNSLDFDDLGENEGIMIDLWLKKEHISTINYEGIIGKIDYNGGYLISMNSQIDNKVPFTIKNEETQHAITPETSIDDSSWHHYIVVWDGTTLYIYIDDMTNPDKSKYIGEFTFGNADKWLDIGNDWPTDSLDPFNGYIDEVRISRIIPAGGNTPPRASFQWTPQLPDMNMPVTFDASESYDLDGVIISFEWDFGDENIGTGEQTSHNYSQPGLYEVVLTVTDNEGAQGAQKKEITVENHRPTVKILNIKQGDIVCGTVIITVNASDPNGDQTLQEVTVIITDLINEYSLTVVGTDPWTCEWNTNEFRDGIWIISAKSYDTGGLVSEPDKRRVWVDNTPPILLISKPLNAFYRNDVGMMIPFFFPVIIGQPFTFVVGVYDLPKGVERVEYRINGELICIDHNVSWLSSCKYEDVNFGFITLQVNATDYGGNNGLAFPKFIFKFF